jgi:phosphoenolpyruvate-protein kinase (PTS system EI component)
MSALRLPAVKQEIRNLTMIQATAFAESVMAKGDEIEVKALLAQRAGAGGESGAGKVKKAREQAAE